MGVSAVLPKKYSYANIELNLDPKFVSWCELDSGPTALTLI